MSSFCLVLLASAKLENGVENRVQISDHCCHPSVFV